VRTRQVTNVAVDGLAAAPHEAAVNGSAGADNCPHRVTAAHIVDARQVLQNHRRVCVPEPVCNWCLTAWPCPEIVRAWYTLPDED
jgi:hypothetical protein